MTSKGLKDIKMGFCTECAGYRQPGGTCTVCEGTGLVILPSDKESEGKVCPKDLSLWEMQELAEQMRSVLADLLHRIETQLPESNASDAAIRSLRQASMWIAAAVTRECKPS